MKSPPQASSLEIPKPPASMLTLQKPADQTPQTLPIPPLAGPEQLGQPSTPIQPVPDIVLGQLDQKFTNTLPPPQIKAPMAIEFPDIRLPLPKEEPDKEDIKPASQPMEVMAPQSLFNPAEQDTEARKAPEQEPQQETAEFVLPDFEEELVLPEISEVTEDEIPPHHLQQASRTQAGENPEPLYIRAADYLTLMNMKKEFAHDLAGVFEKSELLVKMNQDYTTKLDKWYLLLNAVQEKLILIDKKLFDERT
ncbi:MAG: hypothetical protein V1743_03605 [Nanoarchaeota archaeon]